MQYVEIFQLAYETHDQNMLAVRFAGVQRYLCPYIECYEQAFTVAIERARMLVSTVAGSAHRLLIKTASPSRRPSAVDKPISGSRLFVLVALPPTYTELQTSTTTDSRPAPE